MWHKDSAWESKVVGQYKANGYGTCTFSDSTNLNGYFEVDYTSTTTSPKSYPDIKYDSYDRTLVDITLELKDKLPKLEIVSFDFTVYSLTGLTNINNHKIYLEALVQSRLSCMHKFSSPFILDKITQITRTKLEFICQLEVAPLLVSLPNV